MRNLSQKKQDKSGYSLLRGTVDIIQEADKPMVNVHEILDTQGVLFNYYCTYVHIAGLDYFQPAL